MVSFSTRFQDLPQGSQPYNFPRKAHKIENNLSRLILDPFKQKFLQFQYSSSVKIAKAELPVQILDPLLKIMVNILPW